MNSETSQLITWAFQALATGVAVYAASELGKLRETIERLGINLAEIGMTGEFNEKVLDKHDVRISVLEQNRRGINV